MQQLQRVESFFDYSNRNEDGSFRLYQFDENSKDRLYILNSNCKKLLQIIVKDEARKNGSGKFAQLKIIPYAAKRIRVYNDHPGDPANYIVKSAVELTYHGGKKDDQSPKIHMKAVASTGNRYKTLVDCSLCLDSSIQQLSPIGSYFTGYEFDKPLIELVKKKSHKFQVISRFPVRFDFYISGKEIDFHSYFLSIFSINMFFSLDYLVAIEGNPLKGLSLVQPITGFAMKGYYIWVRCSRSTHVGRPFIQFYNNSDYYEKIMNRRIGYANENGSMHWTTMHDKENEITDHYKM